MSDYRSQLQKYFERPVGLSDSGPLKRSNFVLPNITAAANRVVGRRLSDTSRVLEHDGQDRPRGAPERLSVAANEITKKLMFGKTSLEEWEDCVVFANDRARRDSRNRQYSLHRSATSSWQSGIPINASRCVADDWFLNTVIPRIKTGGEYKHSSAVIGNPGCGKSTLLKYLIVKHAETSRRKKIVFSRFEFLKFWNNWLRSGDLQESLKAYMSFINLRDLVICHFLQYVDGRASTLRFGVSPASKTQKKGLKEKIDLICEKAFLLAATIGHPLGHPAILSIQDVLENAQFGNEVIVRRIREMPHSLRIILIGVLKDDYQLTTIFDGLDTVRIEDAFEKTHQFETVKTIIKARRQITQFTELMASGFPQDVDSIVVMRNNTAAFLDWQVDSRETDSQFAEYYELSPVDPTAALVAAAYRSSRHIEELKAAVDAKHLYAFNLTTIIQKIMIAMARGYRSRLPTNLVYRIFDGNLRELFLFLEGILAWQTKEMLRGNYLESHDYTTNDVPRLVTALASRQGTELLLRKGYRVVELLLFREGDSFENVVDVRWTDDPLLSQDTKSTSFLENSRHSGQVDNVFNYLPSLEQKNVDQHGILEKIRIMQLCEPSGLQTGEIAQELMSKFGYRSSDIRMSLLMMLKTNLLTATLETKSGKSVVRLKTTNRGLLCINALIFNLSYLEHVFHKTLLPNCLVDQVDDHPRSNDLVGWVTGSIRNAYILLAYVTFVENHMASGKAVPEKFRISDRMRQGIAAAVQRMTDFGSQEPARLPTTGGSFVSPETLAARAATQISHLLERWAREKVSLRV